ncbi:nucleoside monophosphate kinase [Candidatus Peregrinibacteria bacterium]|nr:nucleoside monophosphate kinase [Candidatus Peregrinibacteria bacterium]
MDLVLFGIQGSGKGTQARKLAEEFGYELFETGAALREIAKTDSDLGRTVKSTIEAGHHVSADIVMDVLRTAVLAQRKETQMIFDGVPRNTDQMVPFEAVLKEAGRDFRCIELHVDEGGAVQRILKRAASEGRKDDASEEPIRLRMQLFHDKTQPVIDAFRERGLVTDIDGEGEVWEVYERLKEAVQ